MTAHHDPGDEDRRADLYCRNCGDPFGPDAEDAALCTAQHCIGAHGSWRPCPNPSPGRPLVDCGVGGTCTWMRSRGLTEPARARSGR